MKEEGEFKKRMIAQSFRHGFRDVKGIEVMACNWFSNEKIRQRDIIQMNDVLKVLDEARRDIFGAVHVEQGDGIRRREINAIKLFAALDKWFGEGEKK